MILKNDRTEAQRATHTWLVIATDHFLSGWGPCEGGLSYAAWACKPADREQVLAWVESCGDYHNVREKSEQDRPYRPRGCKHCHIYVVEDDHPALTEGFAR